MPRLMIRPTLLLLVLAALLLTACGGGAPTATPTPFPTADPDIPPPPGDAANGAALFGAMQSAVGYACDTCHRADSDARLVGPGLVGIAARAESRVADLSAAAYLYRSILLPNEVVVQGYPRNQMPETYSDVFTPEQIADLVAYLLTL